MQARCHPPAALPMPTATPASLTGQHTGGQLPSSGHISQYHVIPRLDLRHAQRRVARHAQRDCYPTSIRLCYAISHKAYARLICCREGSFGHGILNISADGKTMSWTWNRNQDGVAVVTDSVTFVRDTTACPTRGAYPVQHALPAWVCRRTEASHVPGSPVTWGPVNCMTRHQVGSVPPSSHG